MSDQASRMAMDTGAAARHGGGWARRAWNVVPASGMADRLALLTAAAPVNGVASAQGTAAASLSALMAVPARRARIVGRQHIEVRLEDPQGSLQGGRARVKLWQHYLTDGVSIQSRKRSVLVRQQASWRIEQEQADHG
jgi:hypothetical protein